MSLTIDFKTMIDFSEAFLFWLNNLVSIDRLILGHGRLISTNFRLTLDTLKIPISSVVFEKTSFAIQSQPFHTEIFFNVIIFILGCRLIWRLSWLTSTNFRLTLSIKKFWKTLMHSREIEILFYIGLVCFCETKVKF